MSASSSSHRKPKKSLSLRDPDFVLVSDSDSDDEEEDFDLDQMLEGPSPAQARLTAPSSGRGAPKRPAALAQFDRLQFPEAIKGKAAEIFTSLKVTNLRKEALLMAQFYCLWRAHIAKGYQVIPSVLAAQMGLQESLVRKAITKYQKVPGQPSYNSYVGPLDVLAICCRKIDLADDTIAAMQSSFASFLAKDPSFREKKVAVVAVAYICYYLANEGCEASLPELVKLFLLKETSVETMLQEISTADNCVTGKGKGGGKSEGRKGGRKS